MVKQAAFFSIAAILGVLLFGCISNSTEIKPATRITLDNINYLPSESDLNHGLHAYSLDYTLTDDMIAIYAQSGPIPCITSEDKPYGAVLLSCKTKGKCSDTVLMHMSCGPNEKNPTIQLCGCGPNPTETSCNQMVLVASNVVSTSSIVC